MILAVLFTCSKRLFQGGPQSFDYARERLFQKHIVRTNIDIYVFVTISRWSNRPTERPDSPVSSTNKADPHDITELLLKGIALTLLFLHNVNDYNKGQSFSSIYNLSQICLFCLDSVVYLFTQTFTCFASPIFRLCVLDEGYSRNASYVAH